MKYLRIVIQLLANTFEIRAKLLTKSLYARFNRVAEFLVNARH